MNKKEARGFKLFSLVFLLLIGPKLLRIAKILLKVVENPYSDYIQSFQIASGTVFFLIVFLTTGAFVLMYKGYRWAKIVYLILLTIPIGILVYGLFVFLNRYGYSEQEKSMYFNLSKEILYLLVPGLLLFMPSIKSFLNYRYRNRIGDVNKIEEQLNQIGNHE